MLPQPICSEPAHQLYARTWCPAQTACIPYGTERVTRPQYLINGFALLLHIVFNHLAVSILGLGMIGAAVASSLTQLLTLLLLVGTLACGFRRQLLHASLREGLRAWGPFLRLALPGMLMMGEWCRI